MMMAECQCEGWIHVMVGSVGCQTTCGTPELYPYKVQERGMC